VNNLYSSANILKTRLTVIVVYKNNAKINLQSRLFHYKLTTKLISLQFRKILNMQFHSFTNTTCGQGY
jgi:hypothetical protein